MKQITYVKRDRRIYDFSTCLLCGDAYGIVKNEHKAHPPSTCKACGTPQCWTNGLSHGQCSICYVGLLDWFGSKTCGYKGCGKEAIAAAPRVKYACKDHLAKAKLYDCINKALSERDNNWMPVEFELDQFPKL